MNFLWILILVIVSLPIIVILVGYLLSAGNYKGPRSSHFNGKRFLNPSRRSAGSFKDVGDYVRKRKPDKWIYRPNAFVKEDPIPEPHPDKIQYLFINHSTFLIQVDGLNILTDPIWSKRCSPFQFAGPKRMRPPGLKFDLLPNIDIVLISHNHYDHLDVGTIKRLNKNHKPIYVVPLGVSTFMKKLGCKNIIELDWWQAHNLHGLKVTPTPANHFSSRGTFDRNTTQWSGYVINSKKYQIYFVGDTGYGDNFKDLKDKMGPMDLSFIPIGAYLPKWFMGPIHVCPEEAVQIHLDVESKKSVAMHFGTFPLADDNPERSTRELAEARVLKGITEEDFVIPKEGVVETYGARALGQNNILKD